MAIAHISPFTGLHLLPTTTEFRMTLVRDNRLNRFNERISIAENEVEMFKPAANDPRLSSSELPKSGEA